MVSTTLSHAGAIFIAGIDYAGMGLLPRRRDAVVFRLGWLYRCFLYRYFVSFAFPPLSFLLSVASSFFPYPVEFFLLVADVRRSEMTALFISIPLSNIECNRYPYRDPERTARKVDVVSHSTRERHPDLQ